MRDLHLPGRSAVYAANGICATSHPIGAQVAIDVLKSGGNAVDAAIAGALVLGIAEPQMTGIGGDCFVLVKPPGSEEIIALNGSGRAPSRLDAAVLRTRGLTAIPVQGIEAVTLPGAIDAFCTLSADYGLMSLTDTLAPAIRYADEGIPVAPRVAFDWADDVPSLKGPRGISTPFAARPRPWARSFVHPVRPRFCAASLPKAAPGSMRAMSRRT